ncbi:MAG: GIY-YIG nuclease family protein [Mesorhizobium sp.]
MNSGQHYVYVMAVEIGTEDDGFQPIIGPYLKIGIAKNPGERRRQLQTGSPHPLLEVHSEFFPSRSEAFKAEKRAQAILKSRGISGEWFAASIEEAVAAIRGCPILAGCNA